MASLHHRRRLDEAEYELWALEQYRVALERQLLQLIDQTPARALRALHDQGQASDAAAVALAEQETAELVNRVYPRYFRSPFVLVLCGVLEAILLGIAESLRDLKGVGLRFNDLHGDLLDRADKYFRCVLESPLDTTSPAWERIRVVYTVRHCLIHAHGLVGSMRPEQARRLSDLSQGNCGLTVADGYIVLSDTFIQESTRFVVEWLRGPLRELREALDGAVDKA